MWFDIHQVARSSAAAPLSQLVSALEPVLRSAAGLGSWQVVSPAPGGSVRGEVAAVAALADVQGSSFSRPTVLLADAVGGDEDIPEVRSLSASLADQACLLMHQAR